MPQTEDLWLLAAGIPLILGTLLAFRNARTIAVPRAGKTDEPWRAANRAPLSASA